MASISSPSVSNPLTSPKVSPPGVVKSPRTLCLFFGVPVIPQPHSTMEDIHVQRAFGPVAHGDPLPGLGGLLLGPAINPHRRRLRLAAGRGTTARCRRWGDARLGIVQVNPLVTVNIPDKDFALVVERPQERRIAAIEAIKPHPGKADPLLSSVGNHLQGQVVLALKAALLGRDP